MASILNVILRISGQNTAGGSIVALNQGLELAQAGVQALNDTVGQFVRTGFGFNASMETTTLQFKTLMGSADEATKHVQDLFKIGAETPFETGEIIQASRALEVFGGAALDTHDSILMIGDAAAATSAPIAELGNWTGRLYSALQAGRPFGEAAQRLQELAVLSPKARNEMEQLQASGASADEIWKVFTADMGRFTGAMQEQAGTWAGLTSTLKDTVDQLAGTVTHDAFVRIEDDLKRVNAQLAETETRRHAEQAGDVFGLGVQALGLVAEGVLAVDNAAAGAAESVIAFETRTGILGEVLRAADAVAGPLHDDLVSLGLAADDAGAKFESAGTTIASVMEAGNVEIAKAPPLIDQVRDSWEQAADQANRMALEVGGVRDETYRAAAAQQILNQQLQDARDAAAAGAEDMFTRHPDLDVNVATQGNLSGIDAIMKKQQDAARAAEQAAREQAQAEKAAAREAEQAQRQAARETTREWTTAHATAATAAVQSARVQVAAAQAVAAATVDATQVMRAAMQATYGNASGGLLQDTGSQARRTTIYGMPFIQPTIVTNHITNNGPVGVDDLSRQITDTVNAGMRNGSVRVPGLATR